MAAPYKTGTVTLTNGSAVVTGAGTAWQTALIVGGVLYPEADGNPLPLLSVDSNTQLTAATKWKGASGDYAYAIMRDDVVKQQIVATSNALATLIQQLGSPALASLAGLQPAADRLPYYAGANAGALTALTAYMRTLLDDGDAATARATLGAQANLGFTPVQQAGGAGQQGNKVLIGWNGLNVLKAQVDALDLGGIWTDNNGFVTFAQNGYQRLPSGLIIQWGLSRAVGQADYPCNFPLAFPNACLACIAITDDTQSSNWVLTSNQVKTSFDIRTRSVNNGQIVGAPSVYVHFIAVGF